MAAIDVTDATFQAEVIDRSQEVAVVVDLWAPWCGPCRTLGPIIEKVIDATDGKVVLAKVNVDENPAIAQAFQAQSIPAVYALKGGAVVDGFIGAYPEHEVQRFVDSLQPTEEQLAIKELLEAGDEGSLRIALSMEPANEDVIVALAEFLIADGDNDEALALLGQLGIRLGHAKGFPLTGRLALLPLVDPQHLQQRVVAFHGLLPPAP